MSLKIPAALVATGLVLASPPTAPEAYAAEDYDMDCAVILCMAGGFPTGCASAFDYMIDRLTHVPPKPPFGFCAMSDGTEYTDYDAPYSRLSRYGKAGWYCPDNLKLHHKVEHIEGSGRSVEAFCYESKHYVWRGHGSDRYRETVYTGKQAATRMDFQIQITVEPGTASEFRSPVYKVNTSTGFSVEVQQ